MQHAELAKTVLTCISFNPHPDRSLGATEPSSTIYVCTPSVSILTQTEAWVQLGTTTLTLATVCFNPHPDRSLGATLKYHGKTPEISQFQSSPRPKPGCNRMSCTQTRPCTRFNPHPDRSLGATSKCYSSTTTHKTVSILTQTEAWVQPTVPTSRLWI